MTVKNRQIGATTLSVSPVGMGCWPIAGITSPGVTESESIATLKAAVEAGVNFFDTAYCYGYAGESEQLIGRALGPYRDQVVLASKGGLEWDANRQQVRDGRPARLRQQCDESLVRLGTDRIDLYYLHAPDLKLPVADSAAGLLSLRDAGKILAVGVSNFNLQQLQEFSEVCPIDAVQPYYNMLQRDIEADVLPWCLEHGVSVMAYWPLLKGLLAGRISREHQFAASDSRQKYPMFHGTEWQRNHDFVDVLRGIADQCQHTVAEVVINWTIQQNGITSALCGAKRPAQIRETAGAMSWELSSPQLKEINLAIQARGPIATRAPVA